MVGGEGLFVSIVLVEVFDSVWVMIGIVQSKILMMLFDVGLLHAIYVVYHATFDFECGVGFMLVISV